MVVVYLEIELPPKNFTAIYKTLMIYKYTQENIYKM